MNRLRVANIPRNCLMYGQFEIHAESGYTTCMRFWCNCGAIMYIENVGFYDTFHCSHCHVKYRITDTIVVEKHSL